MICIACILALYQHNDRVFRIFGGYAGGNSKVVIFTFDGCGAPCNNALAVLHEKNVAFEEVNLTNSPEGEKRFRELGGGSSLPVTFIGVERVEGFHRQRLTEALSRIYGLDVLDEPTRRVIATHFNVDGSPKLVMYGASWCPYCKKAREFFQDKNIVFTELDVEQDPKAQARYQLIKSSGYPLIYVGEKRFEGFDQSGILQALDSVK